MELTQKPRDPVQRDEAVAVLALAAELESRYGRLEPEEIIQVSLDRFGLDGLAAISSFGADSAALLHIVANVDRGVPVIFLDTGHHFGETLQYRDALAADLGLSNLQIVQPNEARVAAEDPDSLLYKASTDACCDVRKVEPMARGVAPFKAWLTGRKRHQASTRNAIPVFEAVGSRIRINPLASWTTADQAAYMRAHALRENPLVAYGYLSIGCFPCTQPVAPGEDPRSGRWAGQAKTECGIHLSGLDASLTSSTL